MKLALIRDSLRATPRPRMLWLAEFVGNPLFLLLAVLWLQLPETAGGLTLTVLLGLVIAVGFLVLAGATLAWFAGYHAGATPTVRGAFGKGWRHFWLLGIWALVPLAVCRVLAWAEGYQYQLPNFLRSMMPAGMRGVLTENVMLWLFEFVLAVAFWVVLPAFWLPAAARLASHGLGFGREGFRSWGRSLRRLQYWLVLGLAALIGVGLPQFLLDVTPKAGPSPRFGAEMTSLVLRVLLAYLLALFAWMWAASATGRAGAGERSAAG
jgi:hypothetical protein